MVVQFDSLDDPQARRAISERWLAMILAGNFQYLKLYLDRRDGKVSSKAGFSDYFT
jgi:hypothetical protein